MTKKIILCADDYGQDEGISLGIRNLIERGRLTATSCMTNYTDWPTYAAQLKPLADRVDIGLHLNLTEGSALASKNQLPDLKTIFIKSKLRLLNHSAIAAELNAQLDAFIEAMGVLPDYLDGHQHIHHMPIIRDVVLDMFKKRMNKPGQYIRKVVINYSSLSGNIFELIKKIVIQNSGAKKFEQLLKKNNFPHNSDFSGIYHLTSGNFYPQLFEKFIADIQDGGLIMCHPAAYDKNSGVSFPHFRLDEYNYFSSKSFLSDCEKAEIRLVRFKDF